MSASAEPPPPKPDSTSAEVQDYIKRFFLYVNSTATEEYAKEKAAKAADMNGHVFYELSREELGEVFGIAGIHIYHSLHTYGPYRSVSCELQPSPPAARH